jgi:hypothetical protein
LIVPVLPDDQRDEPDELLALGRGEGREHVILHLGDDGVQLV